MYVIIKHVKNKKTGKSLPVIILNSQSVIWEFDTETEANKMKEIFELNSDSGHRYEVKKI
jgi:hypothetical protein